MPIITDEKLKTVCLIGHGNKTCGFLICGPDGFECAKGTDLEGYIRTRIFLEEMTALGDNCNGQ